MAGITSSKPNDLFDPGFDNQTPDFTRNSQGYKADGSMGTLFAGVGDIIKDKVAADDAFLKQRTREEATVEVDQIRNLFSGLDQRQGGWTLQAIGVERGDQIAKEIKNRMDRLGKLDQAYASGRITGTHYWTLLDVAARELRSKYPGYREHIDNVMQDLTGATPANKVVEGIRQDAMRGGKEDHPTKMLQALVKESAEKGWLEPSGYRADSNFMPRNAKGEPVTGEEFINAISKVRTLDYNTQQQNQRLEAESKVGRATKQDVLDQASRNVDAQLAIVQQGVDGIIGKGDEDVRNKIMSMAERAAKNEIIPADQMVQIQAQWNTQRAKILNQINQTITNTPSSSKLSNEDRKNLMENAELKLATYDKILADKNWGLLYHNKAVADVAIDATKAHLIRENETLRNTAALEKVGGQELLKAYYAANPKELTQLAVVLKNRQLTEMAARGTTIKQQVQEAATSAGIRAPQFYDTLVTQMVDTIMSKTAPTSAINNAIEALYGKGNKQFLNEFQSLGKQREYFALMTQPAMADRILQLSKDQGNDNLWANYYAWSVHSFANDKAMEKTAGQLIEFSKNRDLPYGVQYNPQTKSFGVVERKVQNADLYRGISLGRTFNQMQEEVDQMNARVAPILHIFSKTQEDPTRLIQSVFESQGVDLFDLQNYRGRR